MTAYNFQARHKGNPDWKPIPERMVRHLLAKETPDPRSLDQIMEFLRKGEEADNARLVFRAVPIQVDHGRVAWTTAPDVFDGFGTVTLDPQAGTDNRDRAIRKVGIRPEHWDWQTQRYGSGLHAVATKETLDTFRDIWSLKS